MTMDAVCYFKEQEGILYNPVGQLSLTPSTALWWPAGYGAQSYQPNPSPVEQNGCRNHSPAPKLAEQGSRQSAEKGSFTHQFTISSVDSKNPGDTPKSQAGETEHCARFELGFSQPMICAKYPYVDPSYGVFSTLGSQLAGRVMLPLDIGTNDVPIFVNPKQYHAIMKSRERRAKAELKKKVTRARKPYMHESRHLHAMRRPRGCGGRFLNTKNLSNGQEEAILKNDTKGLHHQPRPTGSNSSEVLQSDSGTMSSPREANGSSITSLSGSTEVNSNTYARGNIGRFPINLLHPPVHFSGTIDTGHSIVMPTTWVTAADHCRDLKV